MATYAIQSPPHAGAAIAFTSPPANGDICPCGSGLGLLIVNPTANTTVTVSIPALPDDNLAVGPRVVSCATPSTTLIPLPASVYGSSVPLTYTGTLTTVQVAVITTPGN
jgi:hypothetical protein